MTKSISLNICVQDVEQSIEFYRKLGFGFNEQFTDDKAACLIVTQEFNVMLVGAPLFGTFTTKNVIDPKQDIEAILALACDSRDEVDETMTKALAAGAKEARQPEDLGFMYARDFEDPDGHIWSFYWMDPERIKNPSN